METDDLYLEQDMDLFFSLLEKAPLKDQQNFWNKHPRKAEPNEMSDGYKLTHPIQSGR